jgi:hypothetical protein
VIPRVAQTLPFMSAPQSSRRCLARRAFTKTESTGCLALWVPRPQQHNGLANIQGDVLRQPATVCATNFIAQAVIAEAVPLCPRSGRTALMPKVLSAEDIFPLVDCLSPHERLRLLRLITARPSGGDRQAYHALPPRHEEFSTDQDPLAWDAEGWEDVG